VSAPGAFEDEMGYLGQIRDADAELLLADRAPASFRGGDLEEIASLLRAARVAVPAQPDPSAEASLVRRLAETARLASESGPADTAPMPAARIDAWRPRFALAARIAVAAILVPIAMAGLAFAGVRLPAPARSLLDDVGIDLPNQSDGDDSVAGDDRADGNEGAASRPRGAESDSKVDHGSGSGQPAKHGRGDRGRSHGHRNRHGSAGSQEGGPAGVPPGHGGTPPGQGGTPPGLAAPPPGQGGTPPGQGGAIPGSGSGGQSAESSAEGVPPGQAKK
jgi:hypothetical protein